MTTSMRDGRRAAVLGLAIAGGAVSLLLDARTASADVKSFSNGAADQVWSNDANWTPAGAPLAADDVLLQAAAAPYVYVNGPGATAHDVSLDLTFTIDDFSNSGSASLAVNSISGTAGGMYMRAGKVTANSVSVPYLDIGEYYSIGSTLELGAGGSVNVEHEMIIGRFTSGVTDFGTGTLAIGPGGGSVTASAIYLGAGTGGNGTLNQKAGTVTSVNPMYVGTELLSIGNYIMDGGSFTSPGAYIGVYGATGSVQQTGGTFSAPATHIGAFVPGSTGSYNISGGTLSSAGYLFIGRVDGAGSVNQTGGLVDTGDMYLASDGSGTASYDLQGGTLRASGVFFATTGSPTGTFTWGGGTIQNQTGLDININSFASVLEIQMNGAATHAIDIETGRTGYIHGAAFVSGDGALTKTGEGAFYMLGSSIYTGGTKVLNGTFVVSGAGKIGTGSVTNDSFFDIYTALSVNGVQGSGITTIGDGGPGTNTSTSTFVRQAGLTINTGSGLVIPQNAVANDPAGASKVASLSLAGTPSAPLALLDLQNNAMVIDYTGASPLADVQQLIKAGIDTAGVAGIVATPAADKRLGYGERSALGFSSLAGQTMDSDSIAIKYTYGGDANLDGQVDISDLGALATAWQTAAPWTGGDFNYDAFVDISDLGILATNWQLGVGAPLGPSFDEALASVGLAGVSVPEPTMLGLALLGAWSLKRPRRAIVSA